MTYQPAVYRKQGGDELVIASSGTISLESGSSCEFESGSALGIAGTVAVASGGSLTINSGGTLNVDSGGIAFCDPQSLSSATVSTTITPSGATFLTGSTTGPVVFFGASGWVSASGALASFLPPKAPAGWCLVGIVIPS